MYRNYWLLCKRTEAIFNIYCNIKRFSLKFLCQESGHSRTGRSRCVYEISINFVYICYYLLIIYGGKELEDRLVLSNRKFHEAVFGTLRWILKIYCLIYDFSYKTSRRMIYVFKCHNLLYDLSEISCFPFSVLFEDRCATRCLGFFLYEG